ncbi:MAG: hypothetical protein K0M45_09335 [Candidatus Paracaedibacteraceae bacterium]|nr:hypothetical protein [Candidatus Paracaedibacteraceae bacterium]
MEFNVNGEQSRQSSIDLPFFEELLQVNEFNSALSNDSHTDFDDSDNC